MRRLVGLAVLVVGAVAMVAPPAGAAAGSSSGRVPTTARADFDGDGASDLAIGVPGESVGTVRSAGAINVLYASPGGGLTGTGSQVFHQDVAGVGSTAEAGDRFGQALAVGDFDGDGFDDLAVGAPGEAVGTARFAGAVNVLYGSADGLTGTGSQLLVHASPGEAIESDPGDEFGYALAAGDLDGDGIDDLAIGVPYGNGDAGAVRVAYGSLAGLEQGRPHRSLTQDTPGVGDSAEDLDLFGTSLAAGDLDADGDADLVIGATGESFGGTVFEAGTVHVLFGGPSGVTGGGSLLFTQSTPGVASQVETADLFGFSFALGDFDEDGRGDLAIGTPGESVGTVEGAGAVFVLYGTGTPSRLAGTGSQVFHQDVAGIGSTAELVDNFGTSILAGDFDGDIAGQATGPDDLVVGVPFESVGDVRQAGAINVLFGDAPAGLSGAGSRLITQDSPGVDSTAEFGDGFGSSLAVAADELVVGSPFESVGSVRGAGAINVFDGLDGGRVITQGSPGIAGEPEDFDDFGYALAAPD